MGRSGIGGLGIIAKSPGRVLLLPGVAQPQSGAPVCRVWDFFRVFFSGRGIFEYLPPRPLDDGRGFWEPLGAVI